MNKDTARLHADLAAARAALEPFAALAPGHSGTHISVTVSGAQIAQAKVLLSSLGTGEALAAVRETQRTLNTVLSAPVLATDRGDIKVNVRTALARLKAVFGGGTPDEPGSQQETV